MVIDPKHSCSNKLGELGGGKRGATGIRHSEALLSLPFVLRHVGYFTGLASLRLNLIGLILRSLGGLTNRIIDMNDSFERKRNIMAATASVLHWSAIARRGWSIAGRYHGAFVRRGPSGVVLSKCPSGERCHCA